MTVDKVIAKISRLTFFWPTLYSQHWRNDNDVHCGSQNVSHGECSNCPPSASTQPRSLLRHCLITLSITCWPSCSHPIPPQSADAVHRHPWTYFLFTKSI